MNKFSWEKAYLASIELLISDLEHKAGFTPPAKIVEREMKK